MHRRALARQAADSSGPVVEPWGSFNSATLMVHLSSRSPLWSSGDDHSCVHCCWIINKRDKGRRRWEDREERRWDEEEVQGREGGEGKWEALQCCGEEERCGDVAGRWEVRKTGVRKVKWKEWGEVGERWWKGEKRQRMSAGQQKGFSANL